MKVISPRVPIALTGTWRENAERFFRNPAYNSRVLRAFSHSSVTVGFPERAVSSRYDLAVSAGTIKFGKHAELSECLMIRDASAFAAYERAAQNDQRFVLWRYFPFCS